MPKRKIVFSLMLVFAFLVFPPRGNGGVSEAKYSPEQIREDVEFLWRTIKDVHPQYDHKVPKEQIERHYSHLLSTIASPLDRRGIYRLCCPLVSLVYDAHTLLEFQFPPEHVSYLPLDLIFIEDKAFLKQSYSPEVQPWVGCQIVSINNRPMDDLWQEMETMLPGESRSMKRRSLETDLFKVYCHLLFPGEEHFVIRFRLADGRENEIAVAGVERSVISSSRKKGADPAKLLDLKLDSQRQTALLRVKTFSGKEPPAFFAECFEQLRKEGIQALLIDLRDNLGGDTENAEELISYLTDAPAPLIPRMGVRASQAFKDQMKKRVPGLFRWLPIQNLSAIGKRIWQSPGEIVALSDEKHPAAKSDRLRFKGKTALLINGHTISSASLLAHWLKERRLARVYGQESGYSAAGSFFEPLSFRLPHSGLTLMVSSMVLLDKDGNMQNCSAGVMPDVLLNPVLADEIRGKDSLLEQAWKHFCRIPPD